MAMLSFVNYWPKLVTRELFKVKVDISSCDLIRSLTSRAHGLNHAHVCKFGWFQKFSHQCSWTNLMLFCFAYYYWCYGHFNILVDASGWVPVAPSNKSHRIMCTFTGKSTLFRLNQQQRNIRRKIFFLAFTCWFVVNQHLYFVWLY